MWTLEEAIQLIQNLELYAAKLNFHLALTGSVLYTGKSDNDLDIILYDHKKQTSQENLTQFKGVCLATGLSEWKSTLKKNDRYKDSEATNDRVVYECNYLENKKINIFVFNTI